MIQKGMKSIEVDNFYDENMAKMTIELNENLTPSENTQKYFKKYNKLKTAKKELTEQMAISKDEIEYLENVLLSIENCENLEDLEDIKEENLIWIIYIIISPICYIVLQHLHIHILLWLRMITFIILLESLLIYL